MVTGNWWSVDVVSGGQWTGGQELTGVQGVSSGRALKK